MKENLIKIAQIKIDSGSLLLCDPCRINQGIDFMQTAFSFLGMGDRYHLGNGAGVIVPAKICNGLCRVEAIVESVPGCEQTINEIRIRFIDSDTIWSVPFGDRTNDNAVLVPKVNQLVRKED